MSEGTPTRPLEGVRAIEIGWDALSKANPRLIYASVSASGQDGPNAGRPAYDIIVQAMSGLMAITGDPAGPPTLIGESIADVVSGLFASWAMLAAMVERTRTRSGRRIDVAMFDSMMALQPLVVARYLATSEAPMRVGNRHALSPPFGAFAANDGEFVLAVLASEMAARVTDKRLQIHGGYGFTRDFPLERYVRDVRIMRICEGSSEVQRNIIARGLQA